MRKSEDSEAIMESNNLKDCPLNKDTCEGCPYKKEMWCDYPYVGVFEMPVFDDSGGAIEVKSQEAN